MMIRERYLGPAFLSPFADDMARRLSRISMGPVLETCADIGVLTQALASSISAGLAIVATDPSADLISHASIKPGMARITWQQADPGALPFPNEVFGIVACHFGIATIPNRAQALLEARRTMKAGGRFVFSAPAQIRHNPVAECVQKAIDEWFPRDPPRFLGRVLHGYADTEAIDDDLTKAGFTDAIYTVVDLPYEAASGHEAALGYCLGTSLRNEIEARAPGTAQDVMGGVAAALRKRFGSGVIAANMRALIVSASG